jgi:DNA-binding IclR family transcriptional regulator
MNARDPSPSSQSKSKAPAVDGALDILETLIQSTLPLTLSEIAERVGMPVTTCHRIIGTLMGRNLVVRDLQRRKAYCAGTRLFQMASAAYLQRPIVQLFHPIADVLKNELHQAVYLSVPAGAQALVVAHVAWPFADSFGVHVGSSEAAHRCAAGKAMLSMRPVDVQEHYWTDYIERQDASVNLKDWLHELAEIKRVGYVLTRSESSPPVCTLAAPVLTARGEPLAAMSVSFAARQEVRAWVTPLIQATWQLASRLG